MLVNKIYKHISNTDVALVIDSIAKTEDCLILQIRWYNIVNRSNVFFVSYDEIKIKNIDVQNWELIDVSSAGLF